MKINELLNQVTVQSKELKDKKSVGPNDAFALLLKSEIAGPEGETAPDNTVTGPETLPGLWSLESSDTDSENAPDLSKPISALDSTIDQLDSLEKALQTNKSPKEIDALIQQINSQVASLDDKLGSLPTNHPLREMAEDMKITAYMESTKWKRGDYL